MSIYTYQPCRLGKGLYTDVNLIFTQHFRTAEDYLYAQISEREHSHTLPNLLHFVWHGKQIPQKYLDNIRYQVLG